MTKKLGITAGVLCCITVIVICLALGTNNALAKTEANRFQSEFINSVDGSVLSLDDYKEINGDVVAMIELSDRHIPIVQSQDNEDYLRKNIWKKTDSMGSLFIQNDSSIEASNIIVYGHSSSSNDYMFTPFSNKSYVLENSTFIFESDREYVVTIVAYFKIDLSTEEDLSIFQSNFRNSSELEKHVLKMMERSSVKIEYDWEEVEQIITLVTCNVQTANEDDRYILIGVIEK